MRPLTHLAKLAAVLIAVSGLQVSAGPFDMVDRAKAVKFLTAKKPCELWFLTQLPEVKNDLVSDEVRCIFFGRIGAETVDEQSGCMLSRYYLTTNEYVPYQPSVMREGERCTTKVIAEFLSDIQEGNCSDETLVGGDLKLVSFLRKKNPTCLGWMRLKYLK